MMNSIKQYMLKQDWRSLFAFFLILWFIINILQAVFTEILSDEAYYLLYGENLAWGYFDHPPMIGLMTFVSNFFFDGNLSARFASIVLQIFTILIIWKLLDEKQPDARKIILFFIITASMTMFAASGFTATPDAPFLFFAALFLLFYKKFLESESWFNTIILGLSIAGMMYSKYHTILVVGLVLLSNLKLLTRYKAWIAVMLALLLLLPHIWWQISMDFPSFKYHLVERNNIFKWEYFFEYLPNQLVVFNPLAFGLIIYILVKHKINSVFERAMYFLIVGFFTFFWVSSLRGHVQPQWTVACTIPIIMLIYNHSLNSQKIMRFVKKWILPVIPILLIARVILVTDLLPTRIGFNGKERRDKAVQAVAGQLPVVFSGSFQRPPLYSFFTKQDAFVLSSIHSRRTQYDIWQKELNYHGKPVFIFSNIEGKSEQYESGGQVFWGYKTDNFQSVNRVKIEYTLPKKEMYVGDTLNIHFEIYNPTAHDIDFYHAEFPVTCKIAYRVNRNINVFNGELGKDISILKSGENLRNVFTTVVPELPTGDYMIALTLDNTFCSSRNSDYVAIKILNPKE